MPSPLALAAAAALPLLRRIDAERAHRLAMRALELGLAPRAHGRADPALAVRALGLAFPSPIGLAAGFDKDARVVLPLMRLGFGFVEVGTLTPRPQHGNPRPRLFRLPEERAVINRMGFNNAGVAAAVARLAALRARAGPSPAPGLPTPLGVNVGINKEGADPERDYPALVAAVAPVADYVVLNVSSPNTPGLRDLQGEARLARILEAIAAAVPERPPLLVKLAPDLSEAGLEAVAGVALAHGVQGLIVSNTTLARPDGLRGRHAAEAGGLSGPPLRDRAAAMLLRARRLVGTRLVLVGAGGIGSGADALARIRAGASLVQLYTEFVYAGPTLVPRLQAELAQAMQAQGFPSVESAIGVDA